MNGKQLKNSILQWAIQGKLVPQDPNDEPASVLLERIREEKARLVKEKKIKKDKNESIIFRGDDNSHYEKFADGTVKCIDDEIPFGIPAGWAWCKINNIAFVTKLAGFEYTKYIADNLQTTGVPLFKGKNVQGGKIIYDFEAFIPESLSDELERSQISKKCLLTPYVGTIGNIGIHNRSGKFHLGSNVGKIEILNPVSEVCILEEYLHIYLLSQYGYAELTKYKKATAQESISIEAIREVLVPIPPIQEQHKIVDKYFELEPLVDKYSKSQGILDRLNAEIFEKLKKSVLQEAIQGKLVPQSPDDEPASVLLERIKAEKAKLFKEGKLKKKDLVDSVIFKGEDNKYYEKVGSQVTCIDEEIPFEIPDSWAWIRLGNIFQHNTGKALNGSNQKGVFYDYITTSNLYWNSFVLGKLRSMPFTDDELDKCTVKKGDLLVCEGGDIGRSAIWNYDYDIRIQNHIHRLRAYTPICTMFVYYTLYLYKHTGVIGGKGIGIQGLSSNALHKLLLPLPSIAEQKRIVDKVEFVIASIMRR